MTQETTDVLDKLAATAVVAVAAKRIKDAAAAASPATAQPTPAREKLANVLNRMFNKQATEVAPAAEATPAAEAAIPVAAPAVAPAATPTAAPVAGESQSLTAVVLAKHFSGKMAGHNKEAQLAKVRATLAGFAKNTAN